MTFVIRWFLIFIPCLLSLRCDWFETWWSSWMKLYVHSARSWEKRARCSAPLSSCHYIVFHNVIWNWCNCAMQFLNIIVLSCPLQPCSAHVYDTCACTVDLVLSCTFTNSMNIRASQKVWRCRALSHYCPRIVPADRPSIFSQYAKIRKHVGTRSRLSSIIFTSRKLERTCWNISLCNHIAGNYVLCAERYNRTN